MSISSLLNSSSSTTSSITWIQTLILLAALITTFPRITHTKGRLWIAALNATHGFDPHDEPTKFALFGMGSFWSPQVIFQNTPGVLRATTGYATVRTSSNEESKNWKQQFPPASYLSTIAGDGRVEAVLVEYRSSMLSYADLLEVFWAHQDELSESSITRQKQMEQHHVQQQKQRLHEVSQSNSLQQERAQYKSVLWPLTDDQRRLAHASWEQRTGDVVFMETVVSTEPPTFSPAESLHQYFWFKVRLKLAFLLVGTVVSATLANTVMWMDGLHVTDAVLKFVLIWLLWEGLELVVRGFGSLCGWSFWTTAQLEFA